MTPTIQFNLHNVRNNATKETARVWYSLDNHVDGKPCVTIYSKDYGHALSRVLGDAADVKNDTDYQTDYFDKGKVHLREGHPLYVAARKAAVRKRQQEDDRRAARDGSVEREYVALSN